MSGRASSNPVLAAWRMVIVLLFTGYEAVIIALEQRSAPNEEVRLQRVARRVKIWARKCLKLSGVRFEQRGRPVRGAFLTPNHVSYGDILVLAAASGCSFVPKSDLMSWPIIGPLMRLTGQIAVDRSNSRTLHAATEAVAGVLRLRHNVAVFLEGTTTTNDRVLRFHPSLLQAAIASGAPVQPVAMTWSVDRPGLSVAEDVAYWGDAVFLPHFWRMLGLRGVAVRIEFGRPLQPTGTRKELAQRARRRVVRLAGLPMELDQPAIPNAWEKPAPLSSEGGSPH